MKELVRFSVHSDSLKRGGVECDTSDEVDAEDDEDDENTDDEETNH